VIEEAVGAGEDFDGVVAGGGWGFGRSLGDGVEDAIEGVAGRFEFGVEFVAVVIDPILEGFEEVAGEAGLVALGVAVGADGVEAIG
jgi:hypothetical protein